MIVRWPHSHPETLDDPNLEAEVRSLLAAMTLKQKIGQMIQADIRYISPEQLGEYQLGSVLSGGGAHPDENPRAPVSSWLSLADAFYDASLRSGAVVAPLWGIDALHGHNNVYGATQFPHNIGLGASGNTELVRQIAQATALEVRATGIDWTFAPTLAVVRDDRWGRTYESFGETTSLVTTFTAPAIQGLQGIPGEDDFLDGHHIVATAKHYLGDGGTDEGIDQGDNSCDEETLFELHGKPYLSAIEAGVQVVMLSFSSWSGTKMHGHQYLVEQVLKGQIGFDGIVISDWNGHGQLTASSNTLGHEAIMAGVDMLMAPEDWQGLFENTIHQVENGIISMERIDDAVTRILRVKCRSGLRFPNRPSSRLTSEPHQVIGCDAHRKLARQAVRESAVLLKNNNSVLPLDRHSCILVTGPGAHNVPMQCGGWTISWQGDGTSNDDFPGATSIYSAISELMAQAGGSAILKTDPAASDDTERFDAVVVVFGEEPYAEGQGDRKHLSHAASRPEDAELLRSYRDKGVPVISIFLSGRALWVNQELNASDAFIAAWLPGSEGSGIADLLFSVEGCDFVGRLPFSWPVRPDQTPLNVDDPTVSPLFPYGYGLTYVDTCEISPELPEDDIFAMTAPDDRLSVFELGPVRPFKVFIGDTGDWRQPVQGSRCFSSRETVEVKAVDWQRQEDARRVRWSGGPGQFFLWSENSIDCGSLVNDGGMLILELCLHSPPENQVVLRIDSHFPSGGELDITANLNALPLDEWHTLSFKLNDFVTSGLDPRSVTAPCLLWTDGELELTVGGIRMAPTEAA